MIINIPPSGVTQRYDNYNKSKNCLTEIDYEYRQFDTFEQFKFVNTSGYKLQQDLMRQIKLFVANSYTSKQLTKVSQQSAMYQRT